jgi:hypothetical protein
VVASAPGHLSNYQQELGILADYGGVVYGTLSTWDRKLGKLEYRGWGGEFAKSKQTTDTGSRSPRRRVSHLTKGVQQVVSAGTALHWRTPLSGLMAGASFSRTNKSSGAFNDTYVVPAGPSQGVTITTPGSLVLSPINLPDYFARYEKDKPDGRRASTTGTAQRVALSQWALSVSGEIPTTERPWYAMATYKVTGKLTAGAYHTEDFRSSASRLEPRATSRIGSSLDAMTSTEFLYAKAEQHFISGTEVGYRRRPLNPPTALLPTGLEPTTRLTILKTRRELLTRMQDERRTLQ